MKIDIHITDATEEEARKFFAWDKTVRAADHLLSTMMEGARMPTQPVPAHAAAPWEQPERDLISAYGSGREAVDAYFKQFPDSKRTRSAVQKMWSHLNRVKSTTKISSKSTKLVVAPSEEVKQSVKAIALSNEVKEPVPAPVVEKTARGYNQHGDLQIPFVTTTPQGKKKYAAAWALCKHYGFVPYPEALKRSETAKLERKTAPKKPISAAHQRVHEAVANAPPAAVIRQKINDTIIKQNGPLRAGQHVRHNGSKSSPFFGQIGEIKKLSADGQVYVQFGESTNASLTWLSPYSVAVVPGVGA